MSSRTVEDIVLAAVDASNRFDIDALEQCAVEMEEVGTASAIALATSYRGESWMMRGDIAKAIELHAHSLQLFEERADVKGMARAHDFLGRAHGLLSDFTLAIEHFSKALSLAEQSGNKKHAATIMQNFGRVYNEMDRFPEALEYLNRALAGHEENDDQIGIASTALNLGALYGNAGDYPKSLEFFLQALEIYESMGNRSSMPALLLNIGLVHQITGDTPKAIDLYNRALACAEELGDRVTEARILKAFGTLRASVGDYDGAVAYGQRALDIFEAVGRQTSIAHTLGDLTTAYYESGRYEDAMVMLERADAITVTVPTIILRQETNRAALQEHRLEIAEAKATLRNVMPVARDHNLPFMLADLHLRLRNLCQKDNDFPGYIEHNNEFTRITEEINGKDTATKLAMQEKQREIETREKEHAKHMAVLHSTLPRHIADRVARGEVVNDSFDNAAVLFLDVVGFTTYSSELEAGVVVALLQDIFTTFDAICAEHDVMKIKTIGDSYMAVAFPSEHHVEDLAAVALAMQAAEFVWPHTGERVMFRIGLHCGPVVAGVLGTERMQYDVWGDTVNVASRMESSGSPGRVHVSQAFASNLEEESRIKSQESNREIKQYGMVERGDIEIKGKGMMKTYWIES